MRDANLFTKAAFLDKDGTLMEDIPYNSDPTLFVFSPGVVEGLLLLANSGFRLVIVSNQSGVARGLFDFSALGPMEARLREMFTTEGLELAGVYWCPHFPGAVHPQFGVACGCRKPAPGMLIAAAQELSLDRHASWMIGDRDSDVQAAHNAGCHSAFLNNSVNQGIDPSPEIVGKTFLDLAQQIIRHPSGRLQL